jgi:S-phase kinase-associated protein 1
MADAAAAEKKMLTLQSSDKQLFQVEEAVGMRSQTIKHMIEDDCASNVIPLLNVTGSILAKVIEYCTKHVAAEGPVGPDGDADPASKDDAADLKKFDAAFVDVEQTVLFDLILVRLPLPSPAPLPSAASSSSRRPGCRACVLMS